MQNKTYHTNNQKANAYIKTEIHDVNPQDKISDAKRKYKPVHVFRLSTVLHNPF